MDVFTGYNIQPNADPNTKPKEENMSAQNAILAKPIRKQGFTISSRQKWVSHDTPCSTTCASGHKVVTTCGVLDTECRICATTTAVSTFAPHRAVTKVQRPNQRIFELICPLGHRYKSSYGGRKFGCRTCASLIFIESMYADHRPSLSVDTQCLNSGLHSPLRHKCNKCELVFYTTSNLLQTNPAYSACPSHNENGTTMDYVCMIKIIAENYFGCRFDDTLIVNNAAVEIAAYNAHLKLAINYDCIALSEENRAHCDLIDIQVVNVPQYTPPNLVSVSRCIADALVSPGGIYEFRSYREEVLATAMSNMAYARAWTRLNSGTYCGI